MITPDKLIPRFSITDRHGLAPQIITLDYVVNDLGYLSECEAKFIVDSIYLPRSNSTNYSLISVNNNKCLNITLFNNAGNLKGLIEHLNEKPYEAVLRLRAYGLIE